MALTLRRDLTRVLTTEEIDANFEGLADGTLITGIGTSVQAWDANLDQIAALAVTDGNFAVGNGSAWVAESGATARTSLGLGTIATQDANNVSISGGAVTGITDLAIADGGTGQGTAALAFGALKQDATTAATGVVELATSAEADAKTAGKVMTADLYPQLSPITAALTGDVALNNTANYFTGPQIAQGSVGTWFVSGTVTMADSATAAEFVARLWDGVSTVASAVAQSAGATSRVSISLSGYITSPAGNIRISVKDTTATTGAIQFNASGDSKDASITAIRVG